MKNLGTIDERDLPANPGAIMEEEDCPACGQHKVVKAHSLAEKTRYTLQLNPTDRICLGCQHVQPSPLYAPNNFPSRPSEKNDVETVEIQEKDLPKKIKTRLSKDIEQITGGLVVPKPKKPKVMAEPIKEKPKRSYHNSKPKDNKKVDDMTDQTEEIKKLNSQGTSNSEISRQLGISRWKVGEELKTLGLKAAVGRGGYPRGRFVRFREKVEEPDAISPRTVTLELPPDPRISALEKQVKEIQLWIESWKNKK